RRLRRRDRAPGGGGRGEVHRLVERAPRHRHRRVGGGAVTVTIAATGAAADAVRRVVPQLVSDGVAGAITAQDPTLWGAAAEPEASIRLGWTEAVAVSRGLVDDILALREALAEKGVDRVVLCGMGGSSLAPEVITKTYGAE